MTPITVALLEDEHEILLQGLYQWGGPAPVSDPVAAFVGYPDATAMNDDLPRLRRLLETRTMAAEDWQRVLRATEIAFVSYMEGAGAEWSTVTPFPDDESIEILRRAQRAIVNADTYRR